MNNEKLQYTLEDAYSGNTHVFKFKDGKLIDDSVESNWALQGYINCLENEGYERAYDVDTYKQKWEKAKKAEHLAREMYLEALAYPLIVKE